MVTFIKYLNLNCYKNHSVNLFLWGLRAVIVLLLILSFFVSAVFGFEVLEKIWSKLHLFILIARPVSISWPALSAAFIIFVWVLYTFILIILRFGCTLWGYSMSFLSFFEVTTGRLLCWRRGFLSYYLHLELLWVRTKAPISQKGPPLLQTRHLRLNEVC